MLRIDLHSGGNDSLISKGQQEFVDLDNDNKNDNSYFGVTSFIMKMEGHRNFIIFGNDGKYCVEEMT